MATMTRATKKFLLRKLGSALRDVTVLLALASASWAWLCAEYALWKLSESLVLIWFVPTVVASYALASTIGRDDPISVSTNLFTRAEGPEPPSLQGARVGYLLDCVVWLFAHLLIGVGAIGFALCIMVSWLLIAMAPWWPNSGLGLALACLMIYGFFALCQPKKRSSGPNPPEDGGNPFGVVDGPDRPVPVRSDTYREPGPR